MLRSRGDMNATRKLAGVALIALLLAACSNPFTTNPSAVPQRTSTLAKGNVIASVNATGNIQPESEVRLVFQATGKVAEVKVARGDRVRKGDVLATLDTADLQATLAQAQAGLVMATAAYSRTVEGAREADVVAAQAALNAAYAAYNKLKAGPDPSDITGAEAAVRSAEAALRQAQTANDLSYQFDTQNYPGSPVIAQLEQARNNLEAARLRYDRLIHGADQAQLSAAMQQIQDARARVEQVKQPARPFDIDQAQAERQKAEVQVKQAQRRLEQAVIVAPLDGTVSAVNVKEGEATGTAQTQPAVTLIDMTVLHIDVTVDEIDVARLRPGQEVIVAMDALPDAQLKGKVDRIASAATTVSGVVSYAVRVVLEQADTALRPGMTANTSIVLDKRDGVVVAPNWAIRRDKQSGKSYLTLKVDDKTTREVEVVTGLRNETSSEIVSGAGEGQVIVAPQSAGLLGQ